MIGRRQIAWAILIAAAALLCLGIIRHNKSLPSSVSATSLSSTQPDSKTERDTPGGSPPALAAQNPAEQAAVPEATATSAPSTPRLPTPAAAVADTPESTSLPPETILQNMRISIRQYASAFGENPVGTNPEITSALQGDNPKHINFLKQDGNRVNSQGELVDGWGTPYFFHQVSGHEMEIRSAGPDRVMYTRDDLMTR